jgi:cytochrome b561
VGTIGIEYVFSDGMWRALRQTIEGQAVTGATAPIHVYVGLTMMALVLVRILVRLWQGAPAFPDEMSDNLRKVGVATHLALYALMIAVPALGAGAWFLHLRWMGDLHAGLFNVFMGVAGLHAAAALYHHYVLGDDVMQRMLRSGRSA